MMDYNIESLVDKFSKHAVQADELDKKHAEEFPERDNEIYDGFNFPRALSVMCCEIQRLKRLVDK